ncbi:hypothetical protein PHMEG_00028492 [Phytophthora megakarya]|uniref:Uncharacterized protein n=1 Tax=Phytophthora megakarya TaxID=4795 RepID=A0A225V6C7_9STRA|nr:hypothetical protein PHMEG_00028492 [Phytophthora megakarya]
MFNPLVRIVVSYDLPKSYVRQLREAGWSSKRPKGLETALTYVKPGVSAYGAIGVDVFLGEAAVVDHIIKSGLLRVYHETGGRHEENQPGNQDETDSTVQDDCDGSEAEDVVHPSHIDTSVQLTQGIVEVLFGAPTPSQVDSSQGAVRRAFDISQDGLYSKPSAQDVMEDVAQLQRLSEAFGAESPESDTPFASRLRPQRDFKSYVNFVGANVNLSDYAEFIPGASNDGVLKDDE